MEVVMAYVPVVLAVLLIVLPFGWLAKETYRAIRKTDKVPLKDHILGYIPFISYCKIFKLFYGNMLLPAVWSVVTVAGFIFSLSVKALTLNKVLQDPWLWLIAQWALYGAIAAWYLLMGAIAFDTARLTRRGPFTMLLSFVLPPFGAYIVSKNVRRHFAELRQETHDEFSGKSVGNNNKA